MNNQTLKQNIMLRVKTVHLVRKFIHPLRLKFLILISSFIAMQFLVSVPNVIQNTFNNTSINKIVEYFFFAFFHTHFLIQAITLVIVLSTLWIIRDTIRSFKNIFQFSTN